MRIRKHATKVLGTAASPVSWFSPASAAAAPVSAAGIPTETLCQLNLSPWDATPFDHFRPTPKEEEEGIMGSEIEREEPSSVTASSAGAPVKEEVEKFVKLEREDSEKNTEERKKRGKKKRVKEEEMDGADVVIPTCRKTDGKQWKCKQPAHRPHSFCHYHLTQLRSYNYGSARKAPAGAATVKRRRKREAMSIASVGSSSNFFYYYSAFGPWRAKRRGRDVKVEDDEEEEEDEERGDYIDPDDRDDSDDDDDEEVGVDEVMIDGGEKKKEEEAKRNHGSKKKRGRKPVKARSLKSLL